MSNPIYKELFHNLDRDYLTEQLIEACRVGSLEKVKYLLTSPDLDIHADINGFMYSALNCAAEYGHLDIVKYMLTSPELKEHAKINNDYNPLIPACRDGHLDIVRYLLTSNELKENVDIHVQNDAGFAWACGRGHIDIIKYLMFSDELTEHAKIHAYNDNGFKTAFHSHQLEVIRYFIFDLNIEKTEEITKFLLENPYKDIEKMFEKRELSKSLEIELNSDNINSNAKKIKI